GLCASREAGDVFYHIGGVLENVVREDHHAEADAVAFDDPPGPLVDEARAGAGQQALRLAEVQGAGVGQLVIDLPDLVDERRVEELGYFELPDVPQPGDVVPFRGLDGDDLHAGLLAAQEPARPRHGTAGAQRHEQVGDPPLGLPPDLRPGGPL